VYQRNYYRSKKSGKGKKTIKKLIQSMIILILALILIYSVDLLIHRGEIYPNIAVSNYEIGRMNKIQAKEKLQTIIEEIILNPIIIDYKNTEIKVIPKEKLGTNVEIDRLIDEAYLITRQGTFINRLKERIYLIRGSKNFNFSNFITFKKDVFESFFAQIQSQIEQPAENAHLNANIIIPSRTGIEIDKPGLMQEIKNGIDTSANSDSPVRIILPVNYNEPELTTEKLLSQIGINQLISDYETSLENKEESTLYNIRKASEAINGTILNPGEIFSFNELVGPAEKEDGYKESTIIANGQFVSGYGGGVCQVSTTLYNAVLLANLQIIERYNHSIYGDATNYIPIGRDAAIFFGYKDLKFKNSLDQQIVLFCNIEGEKLIAKVFGEKPINKNIKIITQDRKILEYDIIEVKQEHNKNNDDKVLQEGVPGYDIKTYRVVIDQHGESMEFISHDKYISIPMKILVD